MPANPGVTVVRSPGRTPVCGRRTPGCRSRTSPPRRPSQHVAVTEPIYRGQIRPVLMRAEAMDGLFAARLQRSVTADIFRRPATKSSEPMTKGRARLRVRALP
ncbi:hypothetical protein TBS_13590 [Thermobispora bispora]